MNSEIRFDPTLDFDYICDVASNLGPKEDVEKLMSSMKEDMVFSPQEKRDIKLNIKEAIHELDYIGTPKITFKNKVIFINGVQLMISENKTFGIKESIKRELLYNPTRYGIST